MRHTSRYAVTVAITVVTAIAAGTVQAQVQNQSLTRFDVPAQSLADALKAVGAQANINVLMSPHMVDGRRAPALSATLTVDQAIAELLKGTGISYRYLSDKTVVLTEPAYDKRTTDVTGEGLINLGAIRVSQVDGPDAASASTQLAANAQAPQQQGQASTASNAQTVQQIEEIVVTAQKRGEERLQDVPIPVSVLSASTLMENGATDLQDYYNKVPGVTLTNSIGGNSTVIIRGVATNAVNDNPTTAVSVDDAPYGATTFLGGGLQPIDLDPNDLSRIEVLRGPQGTLYGASSIGGLLRYVMVDPSLEEFSGRVMVTAQGTTNRDDSLGYALRGSINVPLGSNVAMRLSGFDRSEPGYIDDTFSGRTGINSAHNYGGRASFLWQVNDDWSVKLSGVRQLQRRDAANVVDFDPGEDEELESSEYIPNSNGSDREVTFLTGTVQGRFRNVDFTSITGFTDSSSLQREGLLAPIWLLFSQLANPTANVTGGVYSNTQNAQKFSQEFRASIPLGDKIDWLVGAFYTKEKSDYWETISSADRTTGEAFVIGDTFDVGNWPTYEEMALFTSLTVQFTDRFDVQFGARISENRQELLSRNGGFLSGGVTAYNGPLKSKDSPFTYLVTPRFKFNDDWMIYSRIATGYRPGGPSFNTAAIPEAPDALKADTTKNYELGFKGSMFNDVLSIDTSVYYIDWTDIPVGVQGQNSPLSYLANAAGAVSKGLEFAFDVRPTRGLTLSAWAAWNDAYISEIPEPSPIDQDDELPYSPPFSASASIDYERPVNEGMTWNLGTSYRYVGERPGNIGAAPNIMTEYFVLDAHAGLRTGKWTVNAFINNVTDERGRIGTTLFNGGAIPAGILIIRPRTVGISIATDF